MVFGRLGGFGVRPFRTITPISMEASKSKKAPTKAEETAAKDAAADAKRRPIQTFKTEDCSVSIWAREFVVRGKPTTFYSVTFERSYKDRDGAWKYTRSFDPESLGKLVQLCQHASAEIERLQASAK